MNLRLKRLGQAGFDHVMVLVVFVVMFALVGTWLLLESHAATTNVYLHMGSTSGSCVAGTTIQKCVGSPAQTWGKLSGSNFIIENGLKQCLADPTGLHKSATDKNGFVTVASCNSGNKQQQWSWAGAGELKNTSSGGCLNAKGVNSGSGPAGTALIVYTCNGASNEIWKETTATGAGTAQGGSGCSGILGCATAFNGFTYASGGHETSASSWKSACPTITNGDSGCHVDCSGLVNVAVYRATGTWHNWLAGPGYLTLNGAKDTTHWQQITNLADAKPGDVVASSNHVEIVWKGSGSWSKIYTFGAHHSGVSDGYLSSTANYLTPIALWRYKG